MHFDEFWWDAKSIITRRGSEGLSHYGNSSSHCYATSAYLVVPIYIMRPFWECVVWPRCAEFCLLSYPISFEWDSFVFWYFSTEMAGICWIGSEQTSWKYNFVSEKQICVCCTELRYAHHHWHSQSGRIIAAAIRPIKLVCHPRTVRNGMRMCGNWAIFIWLHLLLFSTRIGDHAPTLLYSGTVSDG